METARYKVEFTAYYWLDEDDFHQTRGHVVVEAEGSRKAEELGKERARDELTKQGAKVRMILITGVMKQNDK